MQPRSGALEAKRTGIYLGAGEGALDFVNYARSNLEAWDKSASLVDKIRWVEAARKKIPVGSVKLDSLSLSAHPCCRCRATAIARSRARAT